MRSSDPHWAFGVVAAVAILLFPTRAHAGTPEGIRLTVDAPGNLDSEENEQEENEQVAGEPAPAEAPLLAAWPRAKEPPPPPAKPVREGPRGSGGIAISAVRGTRNGRGDTPIAGAHVSAAWRFGHTRLGATIAVEHDTDLLLSDKYVHSVLGSGPSGRLGGIVGWGAPWNDTFIGFLGEAGVAAGVASGRSARRDVPDCPPCGIPGQSITTTYASPYGGAWLILQIPWRLPVRPIAGLGLLWTPNVPDPAPVSILGELGVVWQAW